MARRQRHFNPVHAGAGFALDARYLTGYSNGASVTSWGSRPGRTFTFTPPGNSPTFSSSVSAAANQPGVSFVSGSSQALQSSDTSVIPNGSSAFTTIQFSTGGEGFIDFCQTTSRTFLACYSNSFWNVIFDPGYFDFNSGLNVLSVGSSFNGMVTSGRLLSGTQSVRKSWFTTGSRATGDTVTNNGGTSPTSFRTGVHHALAVFNFGVSDSLLRRMTDSLAFSYKTPL